MLTIGQMLWYVPTRGKAYEVRVTKIGRKWATLDEWMRVDKDTLEEDGGYGQCYLSKAARDVEESLNIAWNNFLNHLPGFNNPPHGVTVADINAAREVLRIPKLKPNGG